MDLHPLVIAAVEATEIWLENDEVIIRQECSGSDPDVVLIPAMYLDAVIARLQAIKAELGDA